MKIAIVTPYGKVQRESGILYLLGAHLASLGAAVTQLQCNGTLSLCERDATTNFERTATSCIACMAEQRSLASWSSIKSQQLSRFIPVDVVQSSSRIAHGLAVEELEQYQLSGIPLIEVIGGAFAARFGTLPDANNRRHEQYLRLLALSALRANAGLANFRDTWQPTLTLISGSESFLNRLVLIQNVEPGRQVALFSVNQAKRCTEIRVALGDKEFECPLVIDDLSSLRNDTKSWTAELTALLDEVLSFIAPGHDVPARVKSTGC